MQQTLVSQKNLARAIPDIKKIRYNVVLALASPLGAYSALCLPLVADSRKNACTLSFYI